MSTFDVTLILIFAFAIGSLVFIFLNDPVFILKSFLRGLKDSTSLKVRIVSLPIWGPFYITDKIFKLKNVIAKDIKQSRITTDQNNRMCL